MGEVRVHALSRGGAGPRQLPPRLGRLLPLPRLPVRVQQEEVRGLEEPAELGVLHPDGPVKRSKRRGRGLQRRCAPWDENQRRQDLRCSRGRRHGRRVNRGREAVGFDEQEIQSREEEAVEVLLQGEKGRNSSVE